MSDQVAQWASDWADQFDQGWTEKSLSEWVGKKVFIHTPPDADQPKGAVATVIGYSIDTIVIDGRKAHRFSFITDEGLQIPLFEKMQVEEHSE